MVNAMFRVECGKCNGRGEIKAFIGIAGGICFSCNGRGFNMQKSAPVRSTKYAITAIEKVTGERIHVCNISARNEKQALEKAVAQLSRGNGFIADSVAIK